MKSTFQETKEKKTNNLNEKAKERQRERVYQEP